MPNKENKILNPPPWSNIYYRKSKLREGIEDVIENHVDGEGRGVLADYGCGTKPYKPLFSSYISEYIGMDIEDKEHVDRVLSEDGTCDLPDETVHVVLSSQVLEHVRDPKRYLDEAHRILKENGILVLSTHGHMIYHPVPEDYWRWTHQGLREILTQSGFSVSEMRGIIGRAATGGQFLLDGVRPALPNFLQAPFNLFMQWVIRFLDMDVFNPNRDEDASIFLVVAQKE